MSKHNIKKGDEVVVIAGNSRGSRAKVLQMLPEKSRVLVEGVGKRKNFEKKSEQNPNGAIVERESSIHISNIMLASRYDAGKAAKK
jgi:large subunit ribosomal protein L24